MGMYTYGSLFGFPETFGIEETPIEVEIVLLVEDGVLEFGSTRGVAAAIAAASSSVK